MLNRMMLGIYYELIMVNLNRFKKYECFCKVRYIIVWMYSIYFLLLIFNKFKFVRWFCIKLKCEKYMI